MNTDRSSHRVPLHVTSDERALLHRLACRYVQCAARGQQADVQDLPLGELGQCPVVGVFVTLRKGGELRGCIGNFTSAIELSEALRRAATGVVSHDTRFPPVTCDELSGLTVTVSLLHTRELLEGGPHHRTEGIQIGVHGLDIQYHGRAGLLLPSVATDFGLDEVAFLQAVCRKAGLEPDTWQDREATLYRFSALVFGGPWSDAQ